MNAKYFFSLGSLEEECDDGDLIDGDGCSRTCKKEKGFHCVGESGKVRFLYLKDFALLKKKLLFVVFKYFNNPYLGSFYL